MMQKNRQIFVFLAYSFLMIVSFVCALLIFFEFRIPTQMTLLIIKTSITFVIVKLIVFYMLGMHLGLWRYTTIYDLFKLTIASTISALVLFLLFYFRHNVIIFKTVFILDWMISIMLIGGMRVAVRFFREWRFMTVKSKKKNTIIVGAGDAGVMLLKEIRNNQKMEYEVVGFVDDDPHKQKLNIMGCPILGMLSGLNALIVDNSILEVIIALPTADKATIKQISDICVANSITTMTLPSMTDIIQRKLYSQIHKVNPEDMLFREAVSINLETISKYIKGNNVMITGAAGSIGSELAMQIAKFNPSTVVLYDNNENNLFLTELKMAEYFPYIKYVSRVGNVQNKVKLKEVITQTNPKIIYHAAAYKHVPMMEKDPIEAVQNNIFGTKNVIEITDKCGVKKCVLISTDKAVGPVNIMGVTKRVCELLIKHMGCKSKTSYIAVRFGNVLGSNGSVIPLFEEQIKNGGPVKVTHPDIERFFMTISEAVQLTLEASAIGKNGDLFILDMGRPVKILELARNVIELSGSHDIEIEYIGLRPGEKLKEELWYKYEEAEKTQNAKIFHVKKGFLNIERIDECIKKLENASQERNVRECIEILHEIVPEFTSSTSP